jgi:hypothetical protein
MTAVAGCLGGGSDGSSGPDDSGGSDGSNGSGDSSDGGGGLYEGSDFTCADIGEASLTQYDASGTALLCDFEHPDVFDSADVREASRLRVTFSRRFGGDEPYTEDRLLLKVSQSDTGLKQSKIDTDGEAVSEVEFGDRTAYVGPQLNVAEPNRGRFEANIPHEVDGTVRYFSATFILSIDIQTVDGDPDAPEDCATTLDETCRAIAESIVPNTDTTFDEVREE